MVGQEVEERHAAQGHGSVWCCFYLHCCLRGEQCPRPRPPPPPAHLINTAGCVTDSSEGKRKKLSPGMSRKMTEELKWVTSRYPSWQKLSAAFLWPSGRTSTASPWQAHKLTIALFSVSLQGAHIGTVSLCFFTFYLFSPFFVCFPIPPPLFPFCIPRCLYPPVISLELKSKYFCCFFSPIILLDYPQHTDSTSVRMNVGLFFYEKLQKK